MKTSNSSPLSPLTNLRTPKPQPIPTRDPSTTSQYNYPSLFHTAYGPKHSTPLTFAPGFGRTKQSHRDECDINQIMKRFQRTGVLDFAGKNEGQYGDVTGLDYEVGMQNIRKADALFQGLPSSLRARFHNDPREFLDFVQDEDNRAEAARLGLLKAEAEKLPPSQPATADAAREPLRAADGTFREQTRSERREERRAELRSEQSRPETGASGRDTPPKSGG